jgi:hypothetical protein
MQLQTAAAKKQRLRLVCIDKEKTPAGFAGGRRTSYETDQLPVKVEL